MTISPTSSRKELGFREWRHWMEGKTSLPLVVVALALLSTLMGAASLTEVWRTGYFGDTDDALRMVQVRDLMAGQSWFDMTVARIDPPSGLFMHWSRIVDAILVPLIGVLQVFIPVELAERAARIAFSFLMTVGLLVALARTAKALIGPQAIMPAMVLCVLSGIAFSQFRPGRIDHHSPQIVLLMLMAGFTLLATHRDKHRHAAYAAVCVSLSLGISVENLPFIAVISAVWPLIWLRDGVTACLPLRYYATGLLASLPAVYIATIGPSHWFARYCDALSVSYLAPVLVGASGCYILATCTVSSTFLRRITGGLAVGGLSIATMAFISPQCLQSPLASVDPLLNVYWLSNVAEARDLVSAYHFEPEAVIMSMGPALIGTAFLFFAAYLSEGAQRDRMLIVLAIVTVGLVTCFWQFRAYFSWAPIALLGSAWALAKFREWLVSRGIEITGVAILIAALPLSAPAWAIVAELSRAGASASSSGWTEPVGPAAPAHAALRPASYVELAALPKGLVLAPIDLGSHILVHTHHAVLAAAYHRNNRGNRAIVDAFLARGGDAKARVRATKADYVVIARNLAEAHQMNVLAPNGFGARLAAGEFPEWLERVSSPNAVLQIYRIKP